MIEITKNIQLNEDEIITSFIRSPGPGGQNVNKVESAVQIRFDAKGSNSIEEALFYRLKVLAGRRMNKEGIIVITANRTRSQIRNKEDALNRLIDLIYKATLMPKKRKASMPSKASKIRRLESKKHKGDIKKLRRKDNYD